MDLSPDSKSFRHIVRSHQDVYVDAAECMEASTVGGDRGFSRDEMNGLSAEKAGEVAGRW